MYPYPLLSGESRFFVDNWVILKRPDWVIEPQDNGMTASWDGHDVLKTMSHRCMLLYMKGTR